MSGLGPAGSVTYTPLTQAQRVVYGLGTGLGGLVRGLGSWYGLPLMLEGSGPQGPDKWRSLGYKSEAAYREAILKNHQKTGDPLPNWMKETQPTRPSADLRGSVTPGSDEPAADNKGEGIAMDAAERYRPGAGYPDGQPRPADYPAAPPAAPPAPEAPTGRDTSDPTGQSDAKGTQMGSRSASYEEVMKFLGPAAQFLPMNSSALPRTGPGERQQSADIPDRTITLGPDGNYTQQGSPKYMDEDGNMLPGYSRETLIGPDGVESSTVTGPFPADRQQTVTTITPDDPMFAKAFGQDLADKYKNNIKKGAYTEITPDDPMFAKAFGQDLADKYNKPKDSKNSGTDWLNRSAMDNSDESVRRRTAFMSGKDTLQGLKNRDAMYNKYYASGQYHEVPEKGGKTEISYNNEDVRRFMNADIGSQEQADAQTFLNNYKDRIKKGAATAQNPMLNADESEGKVTANAEASAEADFVENNATPTEMKPMLQNTPYGGYVNGKPVDLGSRDTPRNLRYTLTPEEVDEGLANGTLDQMQSELRGYE